VSGVAHGYKSLTHGGLILGRFTWHRVSMTVSAGALASGQRKPMTLKSRLQNLWRVRGLATCCLLVIACAPMRGAGGVDGITAVSSRVSKDYIRVKLPDGSFKPESYAFGDGGNWGGNLSDVTIDKLHFIDVARVIAVPLASRQYVPARDPGGTKLLIMLYWGTTAVPPPYENDAMYQNYQEAVREYRILLAEGDPSAGAVLDAGISQLCISNEMRDRTDFRNASMLGYNTEFSALIGTDYGVNIGRTAMGWDQRDQITEIEQNRYFVVLMAYDFQLMWKTKEHRLLWETRFSINEQHNAFDEALPIMAQYASRYFGQTSEGILRRRVLDGHVDLGELKSLGVVDAPK